MRDAHGANGGEVVVLVEAGGAEVGRIEGEVVAREVEELVTDKVEKVGREAKAQLDVAKSLAASGDEATAADLYGAVWSQRCLVPKVAKKAAKALKKMGRAVEEQIGEWELPDTTPETRCRVRGWSGLPKRSASSTATGRAPMVNTSRRMPPTPVAAPW